MGHRKMGRLGRKNYSKSLLFRVLNPAGIFAIAPAKKIISHEKVIGTIEAGGVQGVVPYVYDRDYFYCALLVQ
ncbi:MAG: hypothetical protein J0L66_12020 [Cytophagales bacterium]|nr:hypothetical protein [Cytophagales bacterium]